MKGMAISKVAEQAKQGLNLLLPFRLLDEGVTITTPPASR